MAGVLRNYWGNQGFVSVVRLTLQKGTKGEIPISPGFVQRSDGKLRNPALLL
jgi:hypothetical protein